MTGSNSEKWLIESDITRLELAIEQAQLRLKPSEEAYGFSSGHLIEGLAAEDLEGHDDEYVRWAGGSLLLQRLWEKLKRLRGIRRE